MPPRTVSNFSIKTKVFEGPLELLLELVERRKLLINDISLASVTDEYMLHISTMQEMSLPNTTQFIALAATLLLVKSKSLLPVLEITEEEKGSIEDLEERLRKYQIFRDASIKISEQFGKNCQYAPQFSPPQEPIFTLDKYCNLNTLRLVMEGVLNDLPKKEEKSKGQIKTTISLEEMMIRLQNRIAENFQVKFSEFRQGETERKVVIVSFLAILELFKQGNLLVTQIERYSDIEIELDRSQTPSYL